MEYCIETYNLTKSYGDIVVTDALSLCIEKGTFHGFLGPNGAGKSTTIKMLTGIVAPTSGSARILGCDIKHTNASTKKRIGVVPEELCLFENLTGPEYLTFIGRMYSLPRKLARDRAHELLYWMDIHDTNGTLILEYSHGMRKKLALCAAIIHDPELLFLDEPFEGIDAVASRTIREVLEKLLARGATIFLTSHILEVVERLCSHVSIIDKGKLLWQGGLTEFAGGKRLDEAFLQVVSKTNESPRRLSWLSSKGSDCNMEQN
ncbi:MAG: ABC transporter ATP-binding protein [Candidatus Hydrogenedentes bacterium]|nr:ABC transporter ATP-binding protein [Candidatus Hydrogenedentota bacterium]